MELIEAINTILNYNWLNIVFKIVAIFLSIGYLSYAIVYHQQLLKMERNALIYYHLLFSPDNQDKPPKPVLFSFSLLQLTIGLVLLVVSLLLI